MITSNEHLQNLVSNAFWREKEVYSYQVNIDNYTQMLTSLPTGEIPANISQFKNVAVVDLPFDLSDEDVDLISKYQYRDRLRVLVRTEKTEQAKAKMVLDSLKQQIADNGGDYTALLAEFKAVEDAKVASA